jgi:hypothetical protein
MRHVTLTIRELAFIAATRGALGFGLACLLSDRIGGRTRRVLGWSLFALGAVATIPAAMKVFGERTVVAVTPE